MSRATNDPRASGPHEVARIVELRRRWVQHWRSVHALAAEREARLDDIARTMATVPPHACKALLAEADRLEQAPFPPFPDELRSLTCGARTRAGTPCKQTGLHTNGRCKLHGGLSTGPTTAAGRDRAQRNLKRGPNPMTEPQMTASKPMREAQP